MAKSEANAPRYRFGSYELDTTEARLYRGRNRIHLQDLPYRLLAILVERQGEIVTREELQRHLWPANTFVEFDNSLGVAIRKVRDSLNDEAEAPRYVETIPKRGYRFLAAVTVLPPAQVKEIQDLPDDAAPFAATTSATPILHRNSYLSYVYVVVATLALFAAGTLLYLHEEHKQPALIVTAAPRIRVRKSVALMGFRNLRGRAEDTWLSAAFAEMLSTELAAGGELRLVSGEDVSRAKSELPLTDEDTLAKSTLLRLRTDPGADLVVLGSYTPLSGHGAERIRLDLRVQDTSTGETEAEDSVTGDENDLFQIVSEAGARLRSALRVSSLTPQGAAAVRVSLPTNGAALRWYAAGRARLWEFDFAGARDLLLKAVAAEPDYSPAHAALSESWEHLGYGAKALTEAQKAVDLSQQLPEEERFVIQGQYLEVSHQWPRAVETYAVLFRRFPDSLEYGLRLASAQRRVNSSDALKTLTVLRNLPPPIGNDPRIDMAEASTLVTEDINKAHTAIENAIAKGTVQGSHLLVARAYGIMCQLAAPMSLTDATSACDNARQSYAAAGDRNNEARTLNDFAGVSYQQGDLVRAEALWREAAHVFRQVGDIEGLAATANNLGDVSLLEGDLSNAKRFLQQAIPNYEALDDKDGVARVMSDLGEVLRQGGDLRAAMTQYQRAKATADEVNDHDVQADVQSGMGDVALSRGDLTMAHNSYQTALQLRRAIGEKQAIAETELAIARLAIEEGRVADAEDAARRCRDQFRQEQQKDDELDASTVLIHALLAQQKISEAQRELEPERAWAEKSHNLSLRLQFQLAASRADLATNLFDEARTFLNGVLRQAKAHKLMQPQYEAQLALAELDKLSGHTAIATKKFTALESNARAMGYGLIAGKASAGHA
jgi:DNA-binding winged helix-turn-helix (wHTH) protein/Tfp pilus assembly protein PilF/TolB-like protein